MQAILKVLEKIGALVQKFALVCVFVLIAAVSFWIVHFYKNPHHAPATPGQRVVLAPVKRQNVPVYLSALGAVTPLQSITVKTQVNGLLTHLLFQDGQMVKAGDVLAEIDDRPYVAQKMEYEGQLARDRALLANAKLDLQRYQTLWKQDSIAKQTLDTQVALVQQYEGTVRLDEGLLQTAEVNLTYCKIVSPIDGRVGIHLIDAGNLVQTSDTTGIVVVNLVSPIYVMFSLPENNIPDIMEQLDAKKILEVQAYNRDQSKLLAVGQLFAMDNQIDATTGTLKFKAHFTNADNHLFPNQFVNVQLLLKTLSNMSVVPTAAVQYGAQHTFVYVYNDNNTVSIKNVTPGITYAGVTIIDGLAPGQLVVIEGSDKLAEGTSVTVQNPSLLKKSLLARLTSGQFFA